MKHLSRERLYRRLGIIVAVLIVVRLSVVSVHHRFPYGRVGGFVTVPYCKLSLFLSHGSAGFIVRFGSRFQEFKAENWSGMPAYRKPGAYPQMFHFSSMHWQMVLPIEVWALVFMLGFLGLFRVWQVFFHPDRGELVEGAGNP